MNTCQKCGHRWNQREYRGKITRSYKCPKCQCVKWEAVSLPDTQEQGCGAAVAAIQFAISNSEGIAFLRCWNEGDFEAIRRDWPEAPEDVFLGLETFPSQENKP